MSPARWPSFRILKPLIRGCLPPHQSGFSGSLAESLAELRFRPRRRRLRGRAVGGNGRSRKTAVPLRQDSLGKTLTSRTFNWATQAASDMKLHDFNCGFKAYRREAVKSVKLYGELNRYIPVLLNSEGFKIAEAPVAHHTRTYGISKYCWTRLVKGGLDLITVIVLTRCLKRPVHFFGGIGLVSGFFGFLILGWLSI